MKFHTLPAVALAALLGSCGSPSSWPSADRRGVDVVIIYAENRSFVTVLRSAAARRRRQRAAGVAADQGRPRRAAPDAGGDAGADHRPCEQAVPDRRPERD